MPKMNVAFSLDAAELKTFDDWRGSLARGPALVKLMGMALPNFEKVNSQELDDDGGPPLPQRVVEHEPGVRPRR